MFWKQEFFSIPSWTKIVRKLLVMYISLPLITLICSMIYLLLHTLWSLSTAFRNVAFYYYYFETFSLLSFLTDNFYYYIRSNRQLESSNRQFRTARLFYRLYYCLKSFWLTNSFEYIFNVPDRMLYEYSINARHEFLFYNFIRECEIIFEKYSLNTYTFGLFQTTLGVYDQPSGLMVRVSIY